MLCIRAACHIFISWFYLRLLEKMWMQFSDKVCLVRWELQKPWVVVYMQTLLMTHRRSRWEAGNRSGGGLEVCAWHDGWALSRSNRTLFWLWPAGKECMLSVEAVQLGLTLRVEEHVGSHGLLPSSPFSLVSNYVLWN